MPPFVLPPREPLSDYRCPACGYGISVSQLPPLCPMCGGADWIGELGGLGDAVAESAVAGARPVAEAARTRS